MNLTNKAAPLTENYSGGGAEFSKPRIAGLDIVRCTAIFTVVGGHFFLNTAFLQENFGGFSMFLQAVVRQVMCVGVPLFLMLTGYLNAGKTLSRSYYMGYVRVLSAYLVYSILTICFREYYLGDHHTPMQWAHAVLRFDAIPYAWYIEMWIGLFALTPFLNVLYRGLTSKRHKQALILTLVMLSLMATFCNRYGMKVWPASWDKVFPLAYFFLGSYIREYQPRLRLRTGLAVILGIALLNPLFNVLLVHDRPMVQPFGGTDTPLCFVMSLCVFLLLYQRDVDSTFLKKALAKVSLLSLDMYLVSYLFDALFYPIFKTRYFVSQAQFGLWWLVLVPLVLVCSFALSAAVNPLLPTGKRSTAW